MRSERATTTVHRLGHGSLATPRHDVAWTATVWGAMAQIGAICGAAAAGCGGGSGGGGRALGGAGLLACGMCSATHQYTNRTHLRFLPVSPSSPESGNPHWLSCGQWLSARCPPVPRPRGAVEGRMTMGRSEPTEVRPDTRDSVPRPCFLLHTHVRRGATGPDYRSTLQRGLVRSNHAAISMMPNGYMRSCAGRGAKAVESRLRP